MKRTDTIVFLAATAAAVIGAVGANAQMQALAAHALAANAATSKTANSMAANSAMRDARERWILPAGMRAEDVKATRIIASSTAVAESLFALGAGEKIVAVDLAAAEVPQSRGLPNVGYETQLSPEGLLAQKPTLVIAGERIGPQTTIDQLTSAKVPVLVLGGGASAESAMGHLRTLGVLTGKSDEATKLNRMIENEITEAGNIARDAAAKPRVMLLMSHGGGKLMVAGRDTAADALISLAHGTNVGAEFSGYKPLTPESAVAMKPDWLIVTSAGSDRETTLKELAADPSLALTPAVKNKRVIVRPAGELLSFGPSLGKTVLDLTRAIYERHAGTP